MHLLVKNIVIRGLQEPNCTFPISNGLRFSNAMFFGDLIEYNYRA